MMYRISSNATLGLKIFIPTVWVVFFGAFTLAFLLGIGDSGPVLGSWLFKIAWTLGFFLVLGTIWLTLWKLRRVEVDTDFVYITDYFKTARYPFHNIEKVSSQSLGIFQLGVITYKVPGIFGKKSYFIQHRDRLLHVMANVPDFAEKWQQED